MMRSSGMPVLTTCCWMKLVTSCPMDSRVSTCSGTSGEMLKRSNQTWLNWKCTVRNRNCLIGFPWFPSKITLTNWQSSWHWYRRNFKNINHYISYITVCQAPRNILICTKSVSTAVTIMTLTYICVCDGKLWHGNRLQRNYTWSSFFIKLEAVCSCQVLSFRNCLWQVSISIKMLIFHKALHTLQTRTLKMSLSIFTYIYI